MSYLIPFLAFWFGYLLGRMDQVINLLKNKHSVKDSVEEDYFEKPRSFLQQAKEENKINISIDESKFVTKVDSSFEKNFQKLGKESLEKDNIESSVSKLAQLKKK